MRKLAKQSFAAAAMALSISTIAVADNDDSRGGKGRSVATLDGKFIFAASGHIIPAAGPAQPKAIVEWIRFNGDGTPVRGRCYSKLEWCNRTDWPQKHIRLPRTIWNERSAS